MGSQEKTTVRINKKLWKKLMLLRIEQEKSSLNEVIESLLRFYNRRKKRKRR